MKKISYQEKLGTKITLSFLCIIVVTIGILSSTMYKQSYNMLINTVGKKALAITKTAAEGIDVDALKDFKTVADMQKESYKKMIGELNNIRKIGGAKYLYVLRKNEKGDFVYILDTADNKEEICQMGEVENDESYDLAWNGEAFHEKKIWIDKEWGAMICAVSPLKNKDGEIIGIVGVDYGAEAEYKAFQKMKQNIILISLGVFILAIILGRFISKKISKPIEHIAQMANKMADYDFNVESVHTKNKDEVGVLVNSFHKMAENVRNLIDNIKQTTKELENTSQIIAASSKQVSIASEEISSSIQQVASGATEQAMESNNSLEITNYLSRNIEKILDKLKSATLDAADMKEKNERGMQAITEFYNIFKEDMQGRIHVRESIEELSEKSKSIGEIVETIKAMADQTNLLALNASIEAARAGEHGRGFAVVADEVRKLAEKSSQATQEIRYTIQEIIKVIHRTSSNMNQTKVIAQHAGNHLNQTKEAFDNIKKSAEKVIKKIASLYEDIDCVEKGKNDVLKIIENISLVSEQSAAATQEISASTEEQTAAVQEVTASIQNLNDRINELSQSVSLFKV